MSQNDATLISALLELPTIEAAAQAVGVSRKTVERRLDDPEFFQAYNEARRQLVTTAAGRISSRIGRAADTLGEVMDNTEAPASARISAARAILEYGLKYGELVDVTRRVDELEARLEEIEDEKRRETGCH